MDEKPNYYAQIPANVRYNENLNSSQKLFYGEITALTFKTGECWASNNYFARLYKVSPSVITNWVKALEKENLIVVDYEKKGKEITKRIIRIVGIQNIEYVFNKNGEGYSKYIKENNTSINNNKLNEFNLYNNFNENLQCDCFTKSTKERCNRKSSFNINGKNYCNQHARDLIPTVKAKRFIKPTLEEVKEYCLERNNNVDAEMFIDYYEANGWVQGKGKPIKDWKACIRTWERNRSNTMSEREKRIEEWLKDE